MMRKKVMVLLVALLICCASFVACDLEPIPQPQESADNSTIHLYLIGGQSNAAGVSPISTANTADLTETFENILYAGETEYRVETGLANSSFGIRETNNGTDASSFSTEFVPVKSGLGRTSGHIGPEYGMAETLNSAYAGERKALVFKTAAGGVSVRNIVSDVNSERYGNWYPPSLIAELPENEVDEKRTGGVYHRFVENFENVYKQLTEKGHKVKVMGMVWMQGESDRNPNDVAVYPSILKAIVTDLRADISEITGEDYSRIPFIAGEVSETHGIVQNSTQAEFDGAVKLNKAFNAMLNEIENNKTISDFFVAEAHDLPQNKMDGDKSVQINPVDQWHWTAEHMLTLGQQFADKLLQTVDLETRVIRIR